MALYIFMTIRKKDGSVFRLRGPNPVMKNQDTWGNYKLHNRFGQQLIAEEYNFSTPVIESEAKPEPEPVPNRPAASVFHCLPALVKQHTDSLYGDSYTRVQYGNPFTFEAVLMDTDDLTLRCWTTAKAGARVLEKSVLYPKTLEKRWWQVIERTPARAGWLLLAIPSEYQPAFSDPAGEPH